MGVSRILHMLRKEFRQVLRDPRMRGLIFFAPLVQLALFTFAINTDVRDITTAVLDYDHTPASRALVDSFSASRHFRITEYAEDDHRAAWLLDRGRVRCLLNIPPGFAGDMAAGHAPPVQLIVDGTDSNTAALVLGYATAAASSYAQGQLALSYARAGMPPPPPMVDVRSRAWFNPNLESRIYFIPGLIALVLTLITVMLTALGIVREKEAGTIEQVMVSPIRPLEYILGKTIPFAVIGFIVITLMLILARLLFHLPIRGDLLWFYLGALLYLFSTLSTGLLISTMSATQQQAMLTAFLYFLPLILLSGFMFPIANMPVPVQWLTLLNPMRYFLVILRGVLLKGLGFELLWPQYLGLLVLGLLAMALASSRFQKTFA
jgi:ABC-2 type transport system permease protein